MNPTLTRRAMIKRLAVAAGTATLAPSLVAAPVGATGLRVRIGDLFTLTNAPSGNGVAVFGRSFDGTLEPAGMVATGGLGTGGGLGNQGALVLSDDLRWVLAVNAGSNEVSVLQNKLLRGLRLRDTVASGGTLPVSITIHRDIVYVLNAGGSGNITGFHLSHNGRLTPLAGSTRPLSSSAAGAAQVEFSPDGRVLVVTEKATNQISTYTVDRRGLASGPMPQASNGATPFGFAFDQRGRLFVSEAFGGAPDGSAVSSYRVTRDGGLQLVDGSEPTTETAACWVAIPRGGRFAYATNTGSGTITGFSIGHDGSLTRLDDDGVTAGAPGRAPLDAATDRSGRFLYVLNSGTDRINAYRIRSDGGLVAIGTPVEVPDGATGMAAW